MTTTLIVICSILFLILIIAVFVIRNLLNKVERYEEDIQTKDEFFAKIKSLVESSDSRIRALDANGAFESDDEVGYFFKVLKDITFILTAYFNNYNAVENEEQK